MAECGYFNHFCKELIDRFHPFFLLVFNKKKAVDGSLSSFKLCAVIETDNKEQTEAQIYLQLVSPIPFDVIVYTPDEWDKFAKIPESFAARILKTGEVIYEKKS